MDLDDSERLLRELKRVLVASAVEFDKQSDSREKEKRFPVWVAQGKRRLFTSEVTETLVHNTLNWRYFGAIFIVEGWRHKCKARIVKVDFMVVVQQIRPYRGVAENMVFVHGISPQMSETEAVTCAEEFRKDLVKQWL